MDKLQIIAGLEIERQELVTQLQSIDITILTLKKSLSMPGFSVNGNGNQNGASNAYSAPDLKYKGYAEAKSNNKKKVVIIVREENRFLHMRQIVEIAQRLEPNVDAESVRTSISQAVYALKLDGTLTNFTVGKSKINVFWGSSDWLDILGIPEPEHMYDESQIGNNKAEKMKI